MSSTTTTTTTTIVSLPTIDIIIILSLAAFIRVLVGYSYHSGQDNYHGSSNAYGGDYEAQRHWMEITLHKPIGGWYYYDLQYWGLDYPPLTAYVSYVCGYISHYLVGPESVALESSRGYEDPTHKAYMRATVLVLDLLIYGTAVLTIILSRRSTPSSSSASSKSSSSAIIATSILYAMLQPAILLIDHGHFQYNTTALGLSLWSFYYMTKMTTMKSSNMTNCMIGSVLFCCALSFKQMTLYYAPAVLFYLLGRCFRRQDSSANTTTTTSSSSSEWIKRFVLLGMTVILTFALLWWPFVVYEPSADIIGIESTTPFSRLKQVLHRIMPFQRGLFEGKVSNIWCVLSLKPINIRTRLSSYLQPIAALILTTTLIIPVCYKLFVIGSKKQPPRTRSKNNNNKSDDENNDDMTSLLWGTMNCSLAFFLGSFQVHEKSLLLSLAPATLLLYNKDKSFVIWFSIVVTWTLWPLIVVDQLQITYICLMIMFIAFLLIVHIIIIKEEEEEGTAGTKTPSSTSATSQAAGFFEQNILFRSLPILSYTVMIGLHVMETFVTVPANLPDLFPVLWSVAGCGMCCLAWVVSIRNLYRCSNTTTTNEPFDNNKSSKDKTV